MSVERIAAWVILVGVAAIIVFMVVAAIAMVLEGRSRDGDRHR